MNEQGPAEAGYHDGPAKAGRYNHRETLAVTLLFILLTAVMTWPQARLLATHAREHQDVFFNLWRLKWAAHALGGNPTRFFDGNIFYPEPRTMTLSDAMLVEGLIGAPLFWIGLPSVLVHNLLLLAPIVASAVGIFVLVRDLTGSRGAGVLAGIVFAFVPYRFEHYMHMELQWTLWTPWAFWAMHRTMTSGRRRDGVLTGVFIGLQMLSSIYYGLFLGTLLPLCGVLMLLGRRRAELRPIVGAFAAGAVVAVVMCAVYAPYLATKDERGGRPENELVTFSARPSSYLVSTPDNVMWGRSLPAAAGSSAACSRPHRDPAGDDRVAAASAAAGRARVSRRAGDRVRDVARIIRVQLPRALLLRAGVSGAARTGPPRDLRGVLSRRACRVRVLAIARDLARSWRVAIAGALALLMLAEYRVRPLALIP